MAKNRSPWQDGRRAWQRLNGWHQDSPSATPGHPDDGDEALAALTDIGLVRHLLDQAELVAVRTARRHRKSWAEIATKLGVSRQSAWERWRDLDDARQPADEEAEKTDDRSQALARAADDSSQVLARAAGDLRRRSTVRVPNVIGLAWLVARERLKDVGLVAVGTDPDGPPLFTVGGPDGVVTDQSPESGAKVPRGSQVTLWLERGGGSGVREPRQPKPIPRVGRARLPEPSDEAVG